MAKKSMIALTLAQRHLEQLESAGIREVTCRLLDLRLFFGKVSCEGNNVCINLLLSL